MASPSDFVPSVTSPGPPAPFSGGTTALQASNTAPTPTLLTTTIFTNSMLDYGPMSSGTAFLASESKSLSSGAPTNPPWRDGSDNLTASPVYLFIFAIALGALIILSLTIVIRSLVLRQRLIALHGPDWRRQYGWTILEMLGLSSRRMWPEPGTDPGPPPGRGRRRDHGRKPVLVDVYLNEGKDGIYWKDIQPYSTSLRHPDTINTSVKANAVSLLSLRAKEYQQPPRSSNRTHSSTRPARDQPPPTPTRSPLSPLRHLPFRATPPPPTSFKPPLNEKYTAPPRHSQSSSSSSVRDLKSVEQPLSGLDVDICLLVRMPNSDAPSYRPRLLTGVSEERQTPSREYSSSLGETLSGGLVIACAQDIQLWGIPEGSPPEIPEDVDSRRGNGQ